MKNVNCRNLLFPIITILLLMTNNSYAQGISTRPLPSSLIPNGVVVQVFSEFMIGMNGDNPETYQSYADKVLGISIVEANQLLDGLVQVVESVENYAQRELQSRCVDGSFARTRAGNSTDAILQSLENYRQDLYLQQESIFTSQLQRSLGLKTEEILLGWITGEFKSKMVVSTIEERKAVNNGLIDIDSKLDSMCTF